MERSNMNFYKEMNIAHSILKRSLLEGIAPPNFGKANLALWNKVQYQIWLECVQKYGFDRNDTSLFGKFGLFFFNYWTEHEEVPEPEEFFSTLNK